MPAQTTPQIGADQETRTSLEPPYRVIIHNDDVTPMDFVLSILRTVFLLDSLRALQVMYTAHYHGSAYVQTLPKPEAIQRVGRAQFTARLHRYPLRFTVEPDMITP